MPTDIEAELDALHEMTTGELAELYRELHGHPPVASHPRRPADPPISRVTHTDQTPFVDPEWGCIGHGRP